MLYGGDRECRRKTEKSEHLEKCIRMEILERKKRKMEGGVREMEREITGPS